MKTGPTRYEVKAYGRTGLHKSGVYWSGDAQQIAREWRSQGYSVTITLVG